MAVIVLDNRIVRAIIGKGGDTVNEIKRQNTDATIDISTRSANAQGEPDPQKGLRVVTIKGSAAGVQAAQKAVSAVICTEFEKSATRADGASAEPLETHNATERKTKQPRLRNAEAASILRNLPEDWDSKSRRAKKNWLQSHK
jgi:tellurite resistance protein